VHPVLSRAVQRHEVRFAIDAPRHQVWRAFHPRMPAADGSRRVIEYPGGRIEIIREGDEHGEGLVRTCEFRVPKWLGTGGKARSWEVVTEVRPDEYASYEAVGKPLWSRAEGWHELTDLPDGRTQLAFFEIYEAFNPVARALFEARVHRFVSSRNEKTYVGLLQRLGSVERL
jgi:hypothetical protein